MSVPSSETTIKPPQRSFWIAVICGAVILTIGIGARQSFGIFQKPIAADLNVGREVWSFANALAVLLDLTDFLNQRDRGYCISMISSRWQAKGANVCGAGGL
jgi:hypothetical protein